MERVWIGFAGILGAVSVAAEAAARHLLAGEADRADLVAIAARYGLFHAAALVALAAFVRGTPGCPIRVAGWCFVAGALLFCGSLLLLAAAAPAWVGRGTPIGGTVLIVGWAALLLHALRPRRAS